MVTLKCLNFSYTILTITSRSFITLQVNKKHNRVYSLYECTKMGLAARINLCPVIDLIRLNVANYFKDIKIALYSKNKSIS